MICVLRELMLVLVIASSSEIVTVVVFFCKQKTAYEMSISDWSSDVCSSDLGLAATDRDRPARELRRRFQGADAVSDVQRVWECRAQSGGSAWLGSRGRAAISRPRADRRRPLVRSHHGRADTLQFLLRHPPQSTLLRPPRFGRPSGFFFQRPARRGPWDPGR